MIATRICVFPMLAALLVGFLLSCSERGSGPNGGDELNAKTDRGFGLMATNSDFGGFVADVISYYSPEISSYKGGVLPLGKPVFDASSGNFYKRFENRINSASAVLIGEHEAQALILNLGRKGWVIWLNQRGSEVAKESIKLKDYISYSDRKGVSGSKDEPNVEAVLDLKFR